MRRTFAPYLGAAAVAAGAFGLLTFGTTNGSRDLQAASGPTNERAIEVAAAKAGGSADGLQVIRAAPFADTGVRQFKLMDGAGNIVGVDLDELGNPVTPEELKNHGQRVQNRGFHGKLEAELADALKR